MKTAGLLILSFFLTISISAQTSGPEAIQFKKNFIVHSAGVPEEFLLFAPDTATQILFNPARANDFGSRFVYVNYLSDYIGRSYRYEMFPDIYTEDYVNMKNPSFSVVSLFGSGEAKWLLEFSNGINKYTSNLNSFDRTNRIIVPGSYYDLSEYSNEDQATSNSSLTSLKVSRIFTIGQTKVSAGIYGILFSNGSSGRNRDLSNRTYHYEGTGSDSSWRYSHADEEQIIWFDKRDKSHIIGLEFTASGPSWDYTGSVDYQVRDNSIIRNIYVLSTSSDSIYNGTTASDLQITRSYNDAAQKPSFINLNSFFRHNTDLIFPDDNLFLSVKAFYSFGTITYKSEFETRFYSQIEPSTGDTVSAIYNDKLDRDNWGIQFSTGYAISKKSKDLSFLSGIRLSGHLEKFGFIDESYHYPGYILETNTSRSFNAALTIPVYLDYTPADYISIYGGINYSYGYYENRIKWGIEGLSNLSGSDLNIYNTVRNNMFNNGWTSAKSIYFGCELRHPSGLRAQFLFDRDITSVPDWNVSLGWVF